MGKRYTEEEISRIKTLTEEGLTSNEIASQLERPEAGIRNIRYRLKMKTDRKESLKQLSRERQKLSEKVNRLRWNLQSLQSRKKEVSKALQQDEVTLETKLESTLRKLKHQKPELFEITDREQIAMLKGQLIGSFIKYLITE